MDDAFALQNQKSDKWLTKDGTWSDDWKLRDLITDRALAFKLRRTFFDTVVVRIRRKRKVRSSGFIDILMDDL